MIKQNREHLAEVFRSERAKLKITQEEACERSGLSRPTLTAIESASYNDIRYMSLCKLAKAYGLNLKMELCR
jgi:transcriptional regulator with XRE-family HTH domain